MSFSLAPHPIGIKWWKNLWISNKQLSFSDLTTKLTDSVYHFTHRNFGRYFYAHRSGPLGMKAAVVVLFGGVKLGSGIYGTRRDELAKKALHKAMDPTPPCVLTPFCQNYDWGKLGSQSIVAQLARSGNGLEVDESKPYAELWMGVHSNGPCSVMSENGVLIPIKEYLLKNSLGEIQFLFKVLSVRKALSIQSHPDAVLARELHAKFPDIYKDPNPKPELAIAISPFRGLYGFRPVEQIVEFCHRFPELLQIIGESEFRDLEILRSAFALKGVYSSLMHAKPCKVKEVIDSILQSSDDTESVVEIARDLNDQYPGGDVGVLSVFFLNIVDLLPGQSIFMGPNVPHAYLSGDLIECMTCSDNVIRGGLTPKFRDVETLLASLDYACFGPPKLLLQTDDRSWNPENVPFAVREYSGGSFELKPETESPAIALVIEGEGSVGSVCVKRGQCLLLIPGIVYRVESEYIRIFFAYTPIKINI